MEDGCEKERIARFVRERDERDFKVAEVMRQVRCGVAEFTLCATRPIDPKFCDGCPEKGRRVDADDVEGYV